jgi:WD40 repeat protein
MQASFWISGSGSRRLGWLLALAIACSGGGPTSPDPDPPAVATVTIAPASVPVSVGSTQQLTVTLRDPAGNVLVGRSVTWTSSDDVMATVDAMGLVRGLAPGQVTITATSEGRTGTAVVTVATPPAAVATVAVSPASSTVDPGATQQLTATLRDEAGNVLVGRVITWTTSDFTVATVDATGLVQGVSPGEVTITAASEGQNGAAAVTVTRPPVTGAKIVFNTDRDGNDEIYIMNPDGTGLLNLTRNPATDSQPTWSPDGSRIAFSSNRDGNFEIYVMNADGSNLERLTTYPRHDGFPSWSGSRIAFVREMESIELGAYEVFVMNSDGTDPINLTHNNPDFLLGLSFSRDGTKIAFTSDRDLEIAFEELWYEIFVMNADGSNPVNVTNTDNAEDGFPEWSPDGSRIAFHSDRDRGGGDPGPSSGFEIYLMDADGSNVVRLTQNMAGDFSPSWSPDGFNLVFESQRDGNTEIYSMNSDGSGTQRLTNHEAVDGFPSWRP